MPAGAESRARAFDHVEIQTVFNARGGAEAVVTVGDLRALFESGLNTRSILRARPDVKPRTVALARAFLIAADPDYYHRVISSSPPGAYKVLVDECLSATDIAPGIYSMLGPAVHTNHVGLNGLGDAGAGDEPLWRWAVHNEYDAILTMDRKEGNPDMDLTAIAIEDAKTILARMDDENMERVDLGELPVVIRFNPPGNGQRSQQAFRYLAANRDRVTSYLETRTSPCIDVSSRKVKPRITYTELYARVLRDRGRNGELLKRRDIWIEQWMDRILREKRGGNPSFAAIKEIEAMVRAAAAICTPMSEQRPVGAPIDTFGIGLG